jgi:pimeloyl-ACP methyl ester carboxylesterase
VVLFYTALLIFVLARYLGILVRIFEEKPLFISPRGQPLPDADEVRVPLGGGLTLAGTYAKGRGKRRGVILFAPEFGGHRWSAATYAGHLLAEGFDLFTFDFRNQGDSDFQPGYEPLQWVTNHEARDVRAALDYLQSRPDADPRGVGLFGVSRGGGAGIVAAAKHPFVRCVVTDGAFATRAVMVPYMRKWVSLYCSQLRLQRWLPDWFLNLVAVIALGYLSRRRRCRFPNVERATRKLAPRPLLMIHGGGDTYIKPPMARRLFECAGEPRTLWVVEKAKHNQAVNAAPEEYRARVAAFFTEHLTGAPSPPSLPRTSGGVYPRREAVPPG